MFVVIIILSLSTNLVFMYILIGGEKVPEYEMLFIHSLFVSSTVLIIRQVNNEAAVLGFVGAPFTLASYVVEGGSSKHFSKIKRLAFSEPKVPKYYLSYWFARFTIILYLCSHYFLMPAFTVGYVVKYTFSNSFFSFRSFMHCFRNSLPPWQSMYSTKLIMELKQFKYLIPGRQSLAQWILKSLVCHT